MRAAIYSGTAVIFRVPTAQEKQGKWQQQKSLSGKAEGILKFRVLYGQVVKSLMLKIKDIAEIPPKEFWN